MILKQIGRVLTADKILDQENHSETVEEEQESARGASPCGPQVSVCSLSSSLLTRQGRLLSSRTAGMAAQDAACCFLAYLK